ncbi:MAG: thymidine kinase [Candidatus Aenigmarchaeota archaeon]|nr:thymidine kinase [Candidatus Aenigmarchaeota archaeon]
MAMKRGWVEVVCGPMYSGKSEELLRRIRRALIARQKVQVFKHGIDDRYSIDSLVSHDGRKVETIPVKNSKEIFDHLDNPAVLVIDEVQFFDDGIIEVTEELINRGIRVIAAGLDRDFKADPFGPMSGLLALAEKVDKITAICVKCGKAAAYTQRIVDGVPAKKDDPIVMVGAKNSYEARCRDCYQLA